MTAAVVRIAAPFQVWSTLPTQLTRLSARGFAPALQGQDAPDVVMVLDLLLGGSSGGMRLRIATQDLTSRTLTGSYDHSARNGIVQEPSIAQSISIGEAASQARSLSFTIRPEAKLSISRAIASGLQPYGVAEVALEISYNGQSAIYDQRLVVMRGAVDGLKFGRSPQLFADRPTQGFDVVEFEVTDPREMCQSWLPPWVIGSTDRFAAPHTSAIGQRLPIVFNGYANIPALRVTSNTVGAQQFIYASGPTAFTVANATGVKVNGVVKTNVDATYAWVNEQTTDLLGVQVSRIRFTNAATAWVDGDAVHVTCTATATADRRTVIQVIEDVCALYSPVGTEGMNGRLFAEASARLPDTLAEPNVLINGSSGGALDWIETTLCAQYPMISMVWEEGGYGPIVVDYRLPAVATLRIGAVPALQRASLVQSSANSEILNVFAYRYGYDALLDAYTKVQTRDLTNSGVCAYSESFAGQRAADPIESVYVQDDGTAAFCVDWLVAHKAQPSFIIEYECLPSAFFTLRRGDTVLLIDPEFDWGTVRAVVEGMEYRRGSCSLALRVFARFVDVGGAALSVPATAV